MGSCDWSPLSPAQVRAWVERHPEALPRSLADLDRFPMLFRKIMLTMVAPAVRLRLWSEHLEALLRTEQELNARQRAFIETTISELPQIFGAPAPNPVIIAWEQRMGADFSRAQASRFFGQIGSPEPPEGIPLPPDALPSPVTS